MNGPPFAVFEYEIRDYYADKFEIYTLHERSALEELSMFRYRGLESYLTEKVYTLQKKRSRLYPALRKPKAVLTVN